MKWPHFSTRELQCKCGCKIVPDTQEFFKFMYHLEELRTSSGIVMNISSGYRCPTYNNAIATTGLNGPHTIAAVDISISGEPVYDLVAAALAAKFKGIGIKQHGPHANRFIHLDRLDIPQRNRIWSYP